jgi:NAD(P)-dependent dehydrogenase (short-subunit alcohol dehydrogenase family)
MTAVLDEKTRAALLEKIPLNALGKAGDIAEAALFHAGPGGRYNTGQTLTVDGGLVM